MLAFGCDMWCQSKRVGQSTCVSVLLVVAWTPRQHRRRGNICKEKMFRPSRLYFDHIHRTCVFLKTTLSTFYLFEWSWEEVEDPLVSLWRKQSKSTTFSRRQSTRELNRSVSNTRTVFADEVVLGFAVVVIPLEHVEPPQARWGGRLVIHHHTHLIAA